MTDNNTFERFVADHLTDDGSGSVQAERLAARISERTDERRQWPRWLAVIKEPPMRTNNHLAVGSPTVRVAAIVLATMLLALSLAAAGVAGQQLFAANGPIVVAQDGSGDFMTISEAVAAAEDGGEVVVRHGTYTEAVNIGKDITLRGDSAGDGEVIVAAPEDGPMVATHTASSTGEQYAVLLSETAGSVSGLTLRGEHSLLIATGGSPTIEGNVFDSVGFAFGTSGISQDGSSIVLNAGTTATVRDNTVTGGGPIAVFSAGSPVIEANVLEGGPHIYLAEAGPGTVVRGNLISGTLQRAIGMSSPGTVLIEDNHLSDISGLGIRVGRNSGAEGFEPTVRNNTIEGASVGIEVTAGGTPKIEANTLTSNDSGISVSTAVGEISANTLIDNVVAMSLGKGDHAVADNSITGGRTGMIITGGAAQLSGNSVEGVSKRGIAITGDASTALRDNRVCDNGENVWVADTASPDIDESNDICEDAPAE